MRRRGFLGASAAGALCFAGSCRREGDSASDRPAAGATLEAEERVLDQAYSDYNHVVVTQRGHIRTMYFVVGTKRYVETTLDVNDPRHNASCDPRCEEDPE